MWCKSDSIQIFNIKVCRWLDSISNRSINWATTTSPTIGIFDQWKWPLFCLFFGAKIGKYLWRKSSRHPWQKCVAFSSGHTGAFTLRASLKITVQRNKKLWSTIKIKFLKHLRDIGRRSFSYFKILCCKCFSGFATCFFCTRWQQPSTVQSSTLEPISYKQGQDWSQVCGPEVQPRYAPQK